MCLRLKEMEIRAAWQEELNCHTLLLYKCMPIYTHPTSKNWEFLPECLDQSIGNQLGGYVTVVIPSYPLLGLLWELERRCQISQQIGILTCACTHTLTHTNWQRKGIGAGLNESHRICWKLNFSQIRVCATDTRQKQKHKTQFEISHIRFFRGLSWCLCGINFNST